MLNRKCVDFHLSKAKRCVTLITAIGSIKRKYPKIFYFPFLLKNVRYDEAETFRG